MRINVLITACCLVFMVCVSALFGNASASEFSELRKWTGKHSRLVWVQDQGSGSDTFAKSKNLMLYGYDSEDGKGERPLVTEVGNYFKPLFTPDGKQVIYSDRRERQMYLLDWQSGRVKKLGSGVAVAVWQDPEPSFLLRKKRTWVYCFSGLQPENTYGTSQPMFRFRLDNPKKQELIWNKTNLAWSSLQLSRDGEVLGGLFPWPHGGVLNTETKEFKRFGRGCWTSLSPDNSKLLWIFDGLHRNIQIHEVNGDQNWTVNINGAPGVNGFEVYHPRWSNHPRYFVLTGPYEKGEGGNKIAGGGEKVEIYLGKFDQQARSVDDWFQATNNKHADFYPELWIEGGGEANLTGEQAGVDEQAVASWPAAKANLVFIWENMKSSNQLDERSPIGFYQCNFELRGRALYSRDFQLNVTGGWAESIDIDRKITNALRSSGKMTLELTVTPNLEQVGSLFSLLTQTKKLLQVRHKGRDLVLQLAGENTDAESESALWENVFAAGQQATLSLSVVGRKAELYVNGKSVGVKKITPVLKTIDFDRLMVGDISGNWSGTVENVALYNRVLNSLAIGSNHQRAKEKVKEVEVVDTLRVEAELFEKSDIPAPDAIGAYRRALVVNSYSVSSVLDGEYSGERVLVAEWAILDREVIKEYPPKAVKEELVLEKFDLHSELEGERQLMDIFEPDLELYYRLPQ